MNKEKIRYIILKELYKGNKDITHEDFGIAKAEFIGITQFLIDEGLVRGVDIDLLGPDFSTADTTGKGEQYLKDNSFATKTYKTLKELRDWFKL